MAFNKLGDHSKVYNEWLYKKRQMNFNRARNGPQTLKMDNLLAKMATRPNLFLTSYADARYRQCTILFSIHLNSEQLQWEEERNDQICLHCAESLATCSRSRICVIIGLITAIQMVESENFIIILQSAKTNYAVYQGCQIKLEYIFFFFLNLRKYPKPQSCPDTIYLW